MIKRKFTSSFDRTLQPYLLGQGKPRHPLVVHLHSWSANYENSVGLEVLARACDSRGWSLLSPDFRGPNDKPVACASPAALRDVIDAVEDASNHVIGPPPRIFLSGGSGGAHMGLSLAHHFPERFSSVSLWNPITDLAAWHAFHKEKDSPYAAMIEKCCGGPPGTTPAVDEQYRLRSPIHHLSKAVGLPIQINVGIHDGHRGSVPIDHSLAAFNVLARANGQSEKQLSPDAIETLKHSARVPEGLPADPLESSGRSAPILFSRQAGPVSLVIFDGAHDTDFEGSISSFESLP